MTIYTGIEYFADILGIPEQNFRIAHSFYSGDGTSLIYPDSWATGAATGSGIGFSSANFNKFFKTGSLYFDGTGTLLSFRNDDIQNSDLSISNSTILLSFEKTGFGDQIILNSIDGQSPYFSGFCLGVNDANKLYFKYWNSIDGPFTFTFSKILSDKNLIFLSRSDSRVFIGRFNSNTFSFETENFEIYRNEIIESNELYVGGYYTDLNTGFLNKNRADWAFSGASNFLGTIDKLYFIYDLPDFYANDLARGLFLNPTTVDGYTEITCYETGYVVDSGYFTTGVTGTFLSGYSIPVTGITGYRDVFSGWSRYGFTGYYDVVVGIYYDQCYRPNDLVQTFSGFGSITGYDIVKRPLTGVTYLTGIKEFLLTGFIWNPTGVLVSEQVCDDIFIQTGQQLYDIDYDYLNSISYKEITLLHTGNLTSGEKFTLINEPIQYKTLFYNKVGIKDFENKYYVDNSSALFSPINVFDSSNFIYTSGYDLIKIGYDEYIEPKLDYIFSGFYLYQKTGKQNYSQELIVDILDGNSDIFKISGANISGIIYTGNILQSSNIIFANGNLFNSGIDYNIVSGIGLNIINKISGDFTFFIKNTPSYTKITGRLNSADNTYKITGSGFNNYTSQLYVENKRMQLNRNYYENAKFDFISGIFQKQQKDESIYGISDDDLFLEYYSGEFDINQILT